MFVLFYTILSFRSKVTTLMRDGERVLWEQVEMMVLTAMQMKTMSPKMHWNRHTDDLKHLGSASNSRLWIIYLPAASVQQNTTHSTFKIQLQLVYDRSEHATHTWKLNCRKYTTSMYRVGKACKCFLAQPRHKREPASCMGEQETP